MERPKLLSLYKVHLK